MPTATTRCYRWPRTMAKYTTDMALNTNKDLKMYYSIKEVAKELGVTDEEDSDDNYDLDLENLLDNCSMNVMGKWECPELKQVITFSILDASIEMDGKEVWRGDWEEKQDENGATTVVCPTADSFEYYAYFNLITDSENEKEYLEGVLSDTGKEKQFVRFFLHQRCL